VYDRDLSHSPGGPEEGARLLSPAKASQPDTYGGFSFHKKMKAIFPHYLSPQKYDTHSQTKHPLSLPLKNVEGAHSNIATPSSMTLIPMSTKLADIRGIGARMMGEQMHDRADWTTAVPLGGARGGPRFGGFGSCGFNLTTFKTVDYF